MEKNRLIIPVFIPHRGCPHDCSFCNQKKIAGTMTNVTEEDVSKIIDAQLENIKDRNGIKEIAFYGGSFTGLDPKQQIGFLRIANKKKKLGLIKDIRISTRPDYISNDILDLLENNGVSIIELGVQSTDDEVLLLNNRGHVREDVIRAVSLIKSRGITLGLQMMLGLYGDTEEKLLKTAKDVIDCKPNFVRIYPTIVIKDTLLEKLYDDGVYNPISLEEAVRLCKKLVEGFSNHNIPIIRLGLQSTEDISIGKSIVAGPYHPAFREMVDTLIFRDELECKVLEEQKGTVLNIYCNPKDCSRVSGYGQSNKEYLKEKFSLKYIKIIGQDRIPLGQVDIEMHP